MGVMSQVYGRQARTDKKHIGSIWEVCGRYMRCASEAYGRCMGVCWGHMRTYMQVCRSYLGGISVYVVIIWEACKRYVEGIWEVCGRYVGGMWEACKDVSDAVWFNVCLMCVLKSARSNFWWGMGVVLGGALPPIAPPPC